MHQFLLAMAASAIALASPLAAAQQPKRAAIKLSEAQMSTVTAGAYLTILRDGEPIVLNREVNTDRYQKRCSGSLCVFVFPEPFQPKY